MAARALRNNLACALALLLVGPVATAGADLSSLKSSCQRQDAADGELSNGAKLPYEFCDDGVPPTGGTTANQGAVNAIPVPERYAGFALLPPKASPDPGSGADTNGDVALDADVSLPDPSLNPRPADGYPLMVMMHTCCSGDKRNFEASTVDGAGETWHYSNAWFAARGYVVLNYTSRGFVDGSGRGSTGQMQLDSRRYEVNDFQHLACQLAGDASFQIDPRRVVVTGGSYGAGLAWMATTDPSWSCGTADRPALRLRLAAAAPRYGWSDLLYSLAPNGTHRRDVLPPADPAHASTRDPFGFPRKSIVTALFGTGTGGTPPSGSHTTFPPSVTSAAACLESSDPYESNPLCAEFFATVVDQVLNDSSPYYQTDFFDGLAHGTIKPVPLFSVGSSSSPLFSQVEHRAMVERLRSAVPRYPVQEYYGDVGDFTQNKAKEWGDLCGADHHVCTLADYSAGLNANPPTLQGRGVTTRLNRFVDRFARPPGNPSAPAPAFDVTAALQVCSATASPERPADEPGPRFTASNFAQLAPSELRLEATGSQTTTSAAAPNLHAPSSDPIANVFNGSNCPVETTPAGPGVATYDLAPLAAAVTAIGRTRVTVPYTSTGAGQGLELNARLYDVLPDGRAVLVDRGGVRIAQPSGTVEFDLNGNGWRVARGDRLRIELAQDDDPYVTRSNQPSTMTLAGVTLQLPVRP
jgi:acetyl esterase/lipase